MSNSPLPANDTANDVIAWTPVQAAKKSNLSRTTIFRAIRNGLPVIRIGRKVLIDPDDLRTYLAKHKSIAGKVI